MTETLIDRTTGSKYGNIQDGAPFLGVAGIFDGDKIANNPHFGAYRGGNSSGWFAVHWSAPKVFSRAVVYGWNDRGFCDNGNGSVTIAYYGKNGTFASGTDGDALGSLTFTDANEDGNGRTVVSNGNAGAYTDWACVVTVSGTGICLAEADQYELTDGSPPPPPPPPPPSPPVTGIPKALVLLWGQSHMVGWAPIIADQSVYRNRSRIKTFQNGLWVAAADPLSITAGPFEFGWMGMGMPFADRMVGLLPDYEIAPIVRAHGNLGIDNFMPGQPLYNNMVSDWHNALATAPTGSFVAGMASWQGESDNGNPSGWGAKRLAIAAAIRGDFALPDLPDVMICCDSRWTGILAEQLGMGLPKNMVRVRTDHFTPPSAGDLKEPAQYRDVGDRVAWALRSQMRL